MTLSQREVIGISVQTAAGTPVNPTHMIPVSSFSGPEEFEQILDSGRRGPDAKDFGAYQGVGIANLSLEMPVLTTDVNDRFPIGYFLHNILACETYTPSQIAATGVYKHPLRLGNQKRYLTLEHTLLRTANDRQFSACRVTELTIRYNAGEGALTARVNMVGKSPTAVTVQTVTDRTNGLFKGWEALIQLNGVPDLATPTVSELLAANSFGRMISAEWTFRRASKPFYAGAASQDFSDLYLGPLEVLCNIVLDFSAITDLTMFRTKAQGSLLTTFRQGTVDAASNREIAINAVKMDWGEGPANLDDSGENITLALSGRGIYSTTAAEVDNTAQDGPVMVEIRQLSTTKYQ